jgi:hypothetical protein
MTRKMRYPVGTRVEDRETKARGVVVHIFKDPELSDTRVVRFGSARDGLAVPVDSIRRAPIAARRRGGK